MKRGFSLIEVLLSSLAMVLVGAGVVAVTTSGFRGYERTTARSTVSRQVSTAIQVMMRDLEEAKEVHIASDSELIIYFPIKSASGAYDRTSVDYDNPIEYFRSTESGVRQANGPCVARLVTGEEPRIVCRNVNNLEFVSSGPSSVNVSLSATGSDGTPYAMNHRAIFMRNN